MKSKDLFRTLQNLLPRKKEVYDKRIMHPVREWLIGLALLAVIALSGGVYSAYMFMSYQHIDVQRSEETSPIVQYNQVLVQTALDIYDARKRVFDSLQQDVAKAPVMAPADSAPTANATSTPQKSEEGGEEETHDPDAVEVRMAF